jgi:EpsD family peptidyl-prolyl cis-trans isomerase
MKSLLFPVFLCAVLGLAGCADKSGGDAGATAVKVGDDRVSVEALNLELQKLGALSEAQTQKATQEVLSALVDQTLLMQAASQAKLADEPKVKQQLESARRQILAEAYIDKLTKDTGKPSDAEISAYFNQHPELFADRHIYNLQELVIGVNAGNIQSVQAQLASTRNLADFVGWLKSQGIPVRGRQLAKPAEQLPTPLLEKLRKAKDGESITSAGEDNLTLIVLAGRQKAPVTLEQAKSVIERYLANSKKKEILAAEVKSLREKGAVEYVAPYAAASTGK